MEWVEGSNYHIVSECGKYKVSHSKGGRPHRDRYSAWRVENQWQAICLGVFDAAEEAKKACDDDKAKENEQ